MDEGRGISMVKYSRQREGILRNLQSRRDHPTADMIYDSVRKEYPNISLGTVYRNLTFLTEICGDFILKEKEGFQKKKGGRIRD